MKIKEKIASLWDKWAAPLTVVGAAVGCVIFLYSTFVTASELEISNKNAKDYAELNVRDVKEQLKEIKSELDNQQRMLETVLLSEQRGRR